MNPFNLKNNALFLSCWYERTRPVQVICIAVLIMSILVLTFLSVSVNETRPEVVWKTLFYVIVGIQLLVLIIQATLFAGNLAGREKTCETLDFHRNSPESANAKVMGLLFGSTCVEWAIFSILFLLELPLAHWAGVSLSETVLFNISLIVSGSFFHSVAAAFSLLSTQKKGGGGGLLMFILIFVFGMPILSMCFMLSVTSPLFSHLLGVTAAQYIIHDENIHFSGRFYTLEFPLIIMQMLVQLPLVFLMVSGIKRTFQLPNSPAWSKSHVLLFCGFIFFMMTGFFMSNSSHLNELMMSNNRRGTYPISETGFFEMETSIYMITYLVIGILISFFCVPSYFKRSKYIVLSRGAGRRRSLFDDGAGSLPVILSYIAIAGVFFSPYLMAIDPKPANAVTALIVLSSYVISFAGFMEYYRLSRFRNNRIFFITVMLVWWVFIPWLMLVSMNFNFGQDMSGLSLSPFFGFAGAIILILSPDERMISTFILPCIAAGVTWMLAWKEHQVVEKQVVN